MVVVVVVVVLVLVVVVVVVESLGDAPTAASELGDTEDVAMPQATRTRPRSSAEEPTERRQPLDKICMKCQRSCVPSEFILYTVGGTEDWGWHVTWPLPRMRALVQ